MPGGRPPEYSKKMVEKAKEYLDGGYKPFGDVVPQIEGLSLYLGLHRDTIYDWIKDPAKAEFSDIIRKIQTAQARALINGGLNKRFSDRLTGRMLSKHGYSEKQEVEHSGEIKQFVINEVGSSSDKPMEATQ